MNSLPLLLLKLGTRLDHPFLCPTIKLQGPHNKLPGGTMDCPNAVASTHSQKEHIGNSSLFLRDGSVRRRDTRRCISLVFGYVPSPTVPPSNRTTFASPARQKKPTPR
jgi:hypothetical protein